MNPFAKYIQIFGKGKNGSRSLTEEEAYDAMKMIACYDFRRPEQIGAFLMLLRVKEETAEEVAGFTRALRESIPTEEKIYRPAIDWAAYAGKKRHLPWFVLAALILARQGYPVLMHGMSRNDERTYVPEALDALDIDEARSINDAEDQLNSTGFAYLPINKISILTHELIQTRDLFGLRPPLHTVARMLNPFYAPLSVMGVFHPNYAPIHQQAAKLLKMQNSLICKGEGGEFERIPDRSVKLYGTDGENYWQEEWQTIFPAGQEVKPERLNLNHFRQVWEGEAADSYGEKAVIGTLAWIIRALKLETDVDKNHQIAQQWWSMRHQNQTIPEAV